MSMKRNIGILTLLGVVVAVSVLFGNAQNNAGTTEAVKDPYSTQAVVDSVLDEYGVQSTLISRAGGAGGTDESGYSILIDVYDENDIPKVEKYLENNLSKDDLTEYKIDIFSNGNRDSYEDT
ncbi:hypothetical protein ACFSFY_06270 [Sporosarcina siberiensis]|uniref:Uncharacterized protein n=1 Tax=Sporosarcina siberiensis TaxID=1365606 RepID=A0ABW4SFQ7_9BACL